MFVRAKMLLTMIPLEIQILSPREAIRDIKAPRKLFNLMLILSVPQISHKFNCDLRNFSHRICIHRKTIFCILSRDLRHYEE